jgi:flagellar hook-associated protein 1 FlgK
LRAALQTASGAPHDMAALRGVLTAAGALAASLNEAADLTRKVRADASASLHDAVSELGSLLEDFQAVNREIVGAGNRGSDLTDQIDRRSGIVRRIAGLVDVRPLLRNGNDMTLFLANGTALFETMAREVSVDDPAGLSLGRIGPALRIDGVPQASGASLGGRIGGLLVVHDEIVPTFSRQLDELARGLIVATAEADQSPAQSGPALAGLFTYPGGPALPAAGMVVDGLAGAIAVNANADPARGGSLTRLRDGGISDPGDPRYVYNASSLAGYGARLVGLAESLSSDQPFDPSTGIGPTSGGVIKLAVDSAGWVEAERAASREVFELQSAIAERAVGAWQSDIGVNLDGELAALIALERSYQASTRLLGSLTGMFDALLAATR